MSPAEAIAKAVEVLSDAERFGSSTEHVLRKVMIAESYMHLAQALTETDAREVSS